MDSKFFPPPCFLTFWLFFCFYFADAELSDFVLLWIIHCGFFSEMLTIFKPNCLVTFVQSDKVRFCRQRWRSKSVSAFDSLLAAAYTIWSFIVSICIEWRRHRKASNLKLSWRVSYLDCQVSFWILELLDFIFSLFASNLWSM